ncbi:MAG: 4-hydroxy-tetrahydrodipicolinate synthase [Chloroflexi bacterium]|nr:4-hydroxy-tetrahydrodipicolinate synthase [Chloroflexota bacterium]
MFDGITTALITPFLPDGNVDYDGMRKNIRFQMENGVRGLLPLGTTGETPTLNESEKEQIVRLTVEEAKGQTPVMVGVGTNSTQKTIENAQKARDWGANALLVVTPYYNKPTQGGIAAHFEAVAASVDLPIVVYNIKGRTGTNIETATLKRIAALENIIAVKEASGNIHQMADVLTEIPDLRVYSGDDAMTFPLICLGGRGVVSVVSNLYPQQVVAMVDHALAGRVRQAREAHFALLPMFKAAFVESNPGPIKYAMSQTGLAAGPLRLPLVEISAASKVILDAVMEL